MDINITAKNTELTDNIRKYIEKKLSRLKRIDNRIISVDVVISVERYNHIVDVKIKTPIDLIKAKESSKDMFSSVDLIYDTLERQLKKSKEKIRAKKRAEELISETPEPEAETPIIVEEEFIPKPLTLEEAIMKLEENEKHFVVFNNAENSKVCVVYKKKNGNIGYIVTR